jgi:hypothetical protein
MGMYTSPQNKSFGSMVIVLDELKDRVREYIGKDIRGSLFIERFEADHGIGKRLVYETRQTVEGTSKILRKPTVDVKTKTVTLAEVLEPGKNNWAGENAPLVSDPSDIEYIIEEEFGRKDGLGKITEWYLKQIMEYN